jgi:hypothetical protein
LNDKSNFKSGQNKEWIGRSIASFIGVPKPCLNQPFIPVESGPNCFNIEIAQMKFATHFITELEQTP